MSRTHLTIAEGSELPAAFDAAFAGTTGWVQAVGELTRIELRVAGERGDVERALAERHTLVQLGGPLGGPYGVVLTRENPAGVQLVAGLLVRAKVVSLAAALIEERPGAPARPTETPAAVPASDASWAAQAAARARSLERARREEAGEEEEEWLPERGDLVQHFAFGLCEVLTADGDRLTTRDLSGTGRVRELRTGHLHIAAPTLQQGKKLFVLARRK